MCVNMFALCVLAVTLLDSMSALADLGWEAYPNEGVSIVQHSNSTLNLITQLMGCDGMFYFQSPSGDSVLAQSWSVCFREHRVLEHLSFLNWEPAGGIYTLFPLRCKKLWHQSLHLVQVATFGME